MTSSSQLTRALIENPRNATPDIETEDPDVPDALCVVPSGSIALQV